MKAIHALVRLAAGAAFVTASVAGITSQAATLTVTHWIDGMYGVPFAVALDKGYFKQNGVDVTVFSISRVGTGEVLDNWTIISDASGQRKQYDKCSFRPGATWSSTRSFVEYPIAWTLEVPEAKLELFTSDSLMNRAEASAAVERMIEGKIDILIGTQMAAKGHHFPNLTLVAVVDSRIWLH